MTGRHVRAAAWSGFIPVARILRDAVSTACDDVSPAAFLMLYFRGVYAKGAVSAPQLGRGKVEMKVGGYHSSLGAVLAYILQWLYIQARTEIP